MGSAANNLWVGTLSRFLSVELYSIFSLNLYLILVLISTSQVFGKRQNSQGPLSGGNFYTGGTHNQSFKLRDLTRNKIKDLNPQISLLKRQSKWTIHSQMKTQT